MKIENNTLMNVNSDDFSNGEFKFLENINKINFCAFENQDRLEKITIPKNIESIGTGIFQSCKNLKSVKFSNKVRYLPSDTFRKCENLTNVKFPENMVKIESGAFDGCRSLKSLTLPNTLRYISSFSFIDCSNLESIHFPSTLRTIDNSAFSNCTSLKKVKFYGRTEELGSFAFNNCSALETVKVPNGLKHIESNCFNNCVNLKNIKLPSELITLGDFAFFNCKSLKKISIPKKLTEIKPRTFSNCSSLQEVKLNENLSKIREGSFENCISLKNITFPSSISKIGEFAFSNCISLENIKFEPGLTTISNNAFSKCESIDTLILPYTIKNIGNEAFKGCKNLRSIMIPTGVAAIGSNVFENCDNLKYVSFPNSIVKFGENNFENFKYFTKEFDGFSLSFLPEESSILMSDIKINPAILSKFWRFKDTLLKEQNNNVVCDFYNKFLPILRLPQAEALLSSHNFTFLKKFNLENIKEADAIAFYKLIYNLGGVFNPKVIDGKKIDYSQKVCEFFLGKLEKNKFSIDGLNRFLQTMETNGFKKDFTDFILANYDKIIERTDIDNDFIAKSYNMFEIIQKTNTSNRGSQRQLKPTVEKFIDYFKIGKFQNVTPENKKIAETIAPFTSRQDTFDNAVNIEDERIRNNTPNNILGFHLKEENPFRNIDKMADNIKQSSFDTIQNLTDTAENEFTFDWLEKNDPTNLILGKLCSCCAHLESVGYSIMHGSIVDPNIQNLVIRDINNEIIAKSTLFINRKEGYGVFNNVEVNTSIPIYKHEQIYEKFMLGAKQFVENYNKKNPNSPIKIVTVGMGNNDLEQLIREKNKKMPVILKAIDYGKYANGSNDYAGDSSISQYVVYNENEK